MSTNDQDALKRAVGEAAADRVEDGAVLGVGTGSTVNAFIDALIVRGKPLAACVSSSEATTAKLAAAGYRVVDLNEAGELALYIDGADECDPARCLVKGGGGALTREKIIAAASRRFLCIVDASKCVDRLGAFPLPIEVIPMARALVARRIEALGGRPAWREGFVTDNGHQILDVHGLRIDDPVALEATLNNLAGVVTVGLFAQRPADEVLVACAGGVEAR
jgi:ribose 5-phosphate isomerase A